MCLCIFSSFSEFACDVQIEKQGGSKGEAHQQRRERSKTRMGQPDNYEWDLAMFPG
jgi:hypothetical protein